MPADEATCFWSKVKQVDKEQKRNKRNGCRRISINERKNEPTRKDYRRSNPNFLFFRSIVFKMCLKNRAIAKAQNKKEKLKKRRRILAALLGKDVSNLKE
jgi:hypothetical protein